MPAPKRKRPTNLTPEPAKLGFGDRNAESAENGPLDGLLVGWPNFDKKTLRMAQHAASLAR